MRWNEFLFKLLSEFTDAFDEISLEGDESKFTCIWPNASNYMLNTLITTTDEIPNGISSILTDKLHNEMDCENLFILESLKNDVNEPILEMGNFSFYSFNEQKSVFKIREMIDQFLELMEFKNKEFYRKYIGGILHMFDGNLITLEQDGIILSIYLIFKVEDTVFLDINFSRDSKNALILLKKILYLNKKNHILTIQKESTAQKMRYYMQDEQRLYLYKL